MNLIKFYKKWISFRDIIWELYIQVMLTCSIVVFPFILFFGGSIEIHINYGSMIKLAKSIIEYCKAL